MKRCGNHESLHLLSCHIGPEPWNVAYVEPSRQSSGRSLRRKPKLSLPITNSMVMKPSPSNIQEPTLNHWKIGDQSFEHDVCFLLKITGKPINWFIPRLGFGLPGYGNHSVHPLQTSWWIGNRSATSEVTYGLERSYLHPRSRFCLRYWEGIPGVKYGEIFLQPEYEH